MKDRDFRWNVYNLAKIAKHRVSQREAEHVVRFAKPPYPRKHKRGDHDKPSWMVVGRAHTHRKIQVLFFIDEWDNIFIFHAMPIRRTGMAGNSRRNQ